MLGAVIGYQTVGRTQVCSWFSKFKKCMTSFENARFLGHPLMNKTDNSVTQVKELLLKNRRVTLSGVLTCWEFHLGKFRAFLKESEHVRLLQNSCTTC
jgi:hypothetical protein